LLTEVLLALLLIDGWALTLVIPLNWLAYRHAPPAYDVSVIAGAALFLFLAYRLARAGRCQAVAILTLAVTSLAIWLSALVYRHQPQTVSIILVYSTLPVLISRLLLSTRAALGMILGNVLGFLLILLLSPELSPGVWVVTLIFVMLISMPSQVCECVLIGQILDQGLHVR
jgi:hypothetical protein